MAPSAEKHRDASGFPTHDKHREHLRRLREGLPLTAAMIERGAAAFTDSVEFLKRLDGRATAQTDGKTDGSAP